MTTKECTWWVNHLFEIRKEEYFNKGWMEDAKEVDEAQQMAIDALSAEAVQVVRCKDCKHYLNEHICMYFSKHGTIETSSDAYCSYGERREL